MGNLLSCRMRAGVRALQDGRGRASPKRFRGMTADRCVDTGGRCIRSIPLPKAPRYRGAMAHDHDASYKRLFATPEMVRDLLLGFVSHDWVLEADLASLERVNGSYVSDNLRLRHDDMVWRIRLRGQWFYVYLLLEFQATSDRWMALRIQVYIGLLYQDLVARGELGAHGMLPAVLPIVLYNGRAPWRASQSLDALLAAPPPGLAPYRSQARYLLIDERRFQTAALPLRNLVAALFRLEAARTATEVRAVTKHLLEWLSGDEHQRIRRAFAIWLSRRLRQRVPEASIAETDDLTEIYDMFPDAVIAYERRKARAEARKELRQELQQKLEETRRAAKAVALAEGRREGRQEGRQEGERAALLRLLERRFGDVDPHLLQQVEAADSAALHRWFDRAIEAPSAAAVFAA